MTYLRLQVEQFTDARLRKHLKVRLGLRTIFGDILNADWKKMAYGVLLDRRKRLRLPGMTHGFSAYGNGKCRCAVCRSTDPRNRRLRR